MDNGALFTKDELRLKHYIFGVHLVVLSMPVFIWPIVEVVLAVSLFVLLVAYSENLKSFKCDNLFLFFLSFFCIFLYKILLGSSLFGGFYFSFAVAILFLIRSRDLLKAFVAFKKVLAVLILPGVLLWLVQVISGNWDLLRLGVLPDQYVLHVHKVESGHKYILYPFLTRIDWAYGSPFYRFQSFFNEPGYLGTVCALIFIGSQGSLKRAEEKVIFLSGVASFSLAFYLLVSIFVFMSFFSKPKRGLILAFTLLIVTVIGSLIFPQYVEERVLSRIQVSMSGLSGDNRSTDYLSRQFEYWVFDSTGYEVFFGVKGFRPDGSSSIIQIPVLTGLAGLFSIAMVYTLLLLKGCSSGRVTLATLTFVFLFSLSAYQRPQVESPLYVFLFVSGCLISLSPRRLVVSNYNPEF